MDQQENTQSPIRLGSAEELKKPLRTKKPGGGKKLGILLLVLLLSAAAYGAVRLNKALQPQAAVNTDHAIRLTETEASDVKKIEIHGKTAVTISCKDGVYTVRELNPKVTSQSACASAFSNAATLLAESVAAQEVTDFAPFGLDQPLSTVTFTYSGGKTRTLEIGSQAPASQHSYVRVDGGSTVYLMKQLLVELFSDGVSAYRDVSGFALSTEGLCALELKRSEDVFRMTFADKPAGAAFTRWQIVQPERANVDNEKVDNLLKSLTEIALKRFVKNSKDQAAYGLDDPQTVLALTYTDGSTVTLRLGAEETGGTYVSIDDTNDVYLVDSSSVLFLQAVTLQNLVNEYANILVAARIEGITVELDGKTADFALDRTQEALAVTRDGVPVDAEAFTQALQTTSTVPINGFTQKSETEGAPAVLTLTYRFNDGQAPYTVAYLDFSINNLALSKDGSVSVTVKKEDCGEMLRLWRALLP